MEHSSLHCAPALAHARSLFLLGRYQSAISQLKALPESSEQLLLLVRAYVRLGDYDEALRRIAAARYKNGPTDEKTSLLISALELFARTCSDREFHAAEALALTCAAKSFSENISKEVDYHVACALFMAGERHDVQRIVSRNLRPGLPQPIDMFTGRFHLLEGWLFAARAQYEKQAESLKKALNAFLNTKERDVGLCAITGQALSLLARDMHIPRAVDLATQLEHQLEWPDDLALQRFQMLRLLGWSTAMEGDYIASIRRIASSARFASGPLCTLISHLDQAWIATISKQTIMAHAALCDAAEYLDSDVSAPMGEDTAAFTLAAELFTGSDVRLALETLDRARQSYANLRRNVGYVHDERLSGMIDFAEAVIREARGDLRVARLRAKRAYEVFSPIGYVWRAGKCATLLYRLTGEAYWLAAAESAAKAYPRSFLAADLERWQEQGRAPQERLTPRQREIFEMLRRGLTFAQIGEALGCSPNTVRVHTGRIYEVFGVPKHAGLQGLFRALSSSAA